MTLKYFIIKLLKKRIVDKQTNKIRFDIVEELIKTIIICSINIVKEKINTDKEIIDDIDEQIKYEPGIIKLFNNFFIENNKYNFNILEKPDLPQLLIHHNLKFHEQIYLNDK